MQLILFSALCFAEPAIDTRGWHQGIVDADESPVDLRFLNHCPAGAKGPVQVDGDRFVFSGTGEEARFWGCNLAAYALFIDSDRVIEQQAARIAKLGYNLVRLHHADSGWVQPNIWATGPGDAPSDGSLDEAALRRLDFWIDRLKQQGVYCWLDLHVGRRFDLERIETLDDMKAQRPKDVRQGKGFCYFDKSLQQVMRESQQKLLDHVNPYTGVAYKDEAAIALLTITNENEIRHSHRILKDAERFPRLHALFEQRARRFADEHNFGLTNVMRSYGKPAFLFRSAVEHEFNEFMSEGLTKPYCTTSIWGSNPYGNLASLTDGSFIDVHDYGTAENILRADPHKDANLTARIAAYHVLDRPLTVSEYNAIRRKQKPELRFVLPLYMAGSAALQQWDALCVYTYAQTKLPPNQWNRNLFNTLDDPGFAAMPAAALAYRRGDVAASIGRFVLPLDRKDLFSTRGYRQNLACRTLAEQSQFTVALSEEETLPWLRATPLRSDNSVRKIAGLDVDLLPSDARLVRSDTGEVWRDWVAGIHAVDTPRTQAAQGHMAGRTIRLKNVTVAAPPDSPAASICVSSLTNAPIETSHKLFITAVSRTVSPEKSHIYLSEPVRATLEIAARPGMRLRPRLGNGTDGPVIDTEYRGGRYLVQLGDLATHWYVLSGDGP